MASTDIAKRLYAAFATGDGATLSAVLSDTKWVNARGGPYGGTYRGFTEVAENIFGPIGREVRDFAAKPDEFLPIGDDRVLALGVYRGITDAGPLDIRFAHLITVAGDRISHFEQFTDTHEWRNAVGG